MTQAPCYECVKTMLLHAPHTKYTKDYIKTCSDDCLKMFTPTDEFNKS
jgi:hypothetical protein